MTGRKLSTRSPTERFTPKGPSSVNSGAVAGQIAYLSQAEEDDADCVVIDTPPHAGGTIDAAIRAADLLIIPIRSTPFHINVAAGTVEIMKQTGRQGRFVLSQVAAVGPQGDDTAAVLQELYPDVPVAKARLWQRKAFMQALISGQAITEFDRPSSKAVTEIKALFREVRSRL